MFKAAVDATYQVLAEDAWRPSEELLAAICRWIDVEYDDGDYHNHPNVILQYTTDIPKKYQQAGKLYRGEQLHEDAHDALASNGSTVVDGMAWTTDFKVATDFAKDNDSRYAIVWKYTPKENEVAINIGALYTDFKELFPKTGKNDQCDKRAGRESEVILREQVEVDGSNVSMIIRANGRSKSFALDPRLKEDFGRGL